MSTAALPRAPLRVLSVIPPMTQLNTPYPSTAYLTGFLRAQGEDAVQADLALALVLALFTPEGLSRVQTQALTLPEASRSASVHCFLDNFANYHATIAPTIAFLQGRDSTLSHRIAGRGFLPEGPRFAALDVYGDAEAADPLAWAFGALGQQDRARHLATLYLNDLADVLQTPLHVTRHQPQQKSSRYFLHRLPILIGRLIRPHRIHRIHLPTCLPVPRITCGTLAMAPHRR